MRVASFVLLILCSGCASMCDSSFDCDFHAFGGLRDRVDRTHGRVGSIFDPAEALAAPVSPMPVPAQVMDSDDDVNAQDAAGEELDSEESTELRERLLDALDDAEDLPDIPESPRDGGSLEFGDTI